jgi:hypothetical protein
MSGDGEVGHGRCHVSVGRFLSVAILDEEALLAMCACIDLNPVTPRIAQGHIARTRRIAGKRIATTCNESARREIRFALKAHAMQVGGERLPRRSDRSTARAPGTLTSHLLSPTTSGYSVLQVVDGQTHFAASTSVVRGATRSKETDGHWQDFPTFTDLFGSANVASGF